MEKAIPLIKEGENSSLVLNQDALDIILRKIGVKDNIAIAVCVGKYRSGKSFLLSHLNNKLLNKPDGKPQAFKLGHTIESCTTGCLMTINEVEIKNESGYLILIDLEGLDANVVRESWDRKLFLFGMVLCTVFICNIKSCLSAESFKNLALITDLVERIQFGTSSRAKETDEKAVFIAAIRDFELQITKSPKEYINDHISGRGFKNSNNNNVNRDTTIDAMREFFRSFECSLLSDPLTENTKHTSENISYNRLPKKFQQDFGIFYNVFTENLTAKSINGTKLNGVKLVEYLKIIVDLINKDKIISFHDTIENAIRAEQVYYEQAIQLYEQKMKELILPIKCESFEQNHQMIYRLCLSEFNITEDSRVCENIKARIIEVRNRYEINNQNKVLEQNTELSKEFWFREYNLNYFSVELFEEKLKEFKERFTSFQFDGDKYPIDDSFWYKFEKLIGIEKIKKSILFFTKYVEMSQAKIRVEYMTKACDKAKAYYVLYTDNNRIFSNAIAANNGGARMYYEGRRDYGGLIANGWSKEYHDEDANLKKELETLNKLEEEYKNLTMN